LVKSVTIASFSKIETKDRSQNPEGVSLSMGVEREGVRGLLRFLDSDF
jgi:hypothetical protein